MTPNHNSRLQPRFLIETILHRADSSVFENEIDQGLAETSRATVVALALTISRIIGPPSLS